MNSLSRPALQQDPQAVSDPAAIDPQQGIATVDVPLAVKIWRIAMRRRWLIIGSILVFTLLGLLFTLTRTPLYTATAQIEISREGSRVVNIESVERETSQFDLEFYQTQYGLLASNSLAERVVRSLELYNDPQFESVFGPLIVEQIEGEGQLPTARLRELQVRRAADLVLGAVEIAPIRASSLVDIVVTTPDPELSARIANAWGINFIEMNLNRRFEATQYARDFLEERLTQLRDRLEESERELVSYASEQNIINLDQTVDTATGRTVAQRSVQAEQLATLNEELARAEAERIRLQTLPRSGSASPEALNSSTLSTLRGRRAELEAEYQNLMAQFQPNYPPARALREQIEALDQSIDQEQDRVATSLSGVASAAGERAAALRSQVAGLEDNLNDLRRRSIQYNIYQREVDTNRTLYDGLLQRYKEIGIAGGVGTNNIAVVDDAEVPVAPSSPNHLLNILMSLALGGFVGAALAILMEQIDEGISDPSSVTKALGSPLLGVVPNMEDSEPLEELKDLRSSMVEAYIAIQTNLDLSTTHGAPKSLSVTSTRPQEGKSTTSYALAHTLARSGRRVALIDGDMRSPSVHREFGIPNKKGLSNALTGQEDLAALLHPTSIETLQFMTAGPQPPNAADLLIGNKLKALIDRLLESYDHVVIDSPPVLGLADAPLIAAAVEGTIYAVEANAIRTSRVRAAMSRLTSANSNILGVVLTKFEMQNSQYSYAYDYQYRYGSSPDPA